MSDPTKTPVPDLTGAAIVRPGDVLTEMRTGVPAPRAEENARPERMLEWFKYAHLPEPLQSTSREFCDLADWIVSAIKPGPERTAALRKLLEAKDAAVRATLVPGG